MSNNDRFTISECGYMVDFSNKLEGINQYVKYNLMRTLRIFDWSGLPESIPARELEKLLQVYGYAGIIDIRGTKYAVVGGLGGPRDEYLRPTKLIVSNAALLTKYPAMQTNYTIGKDCAIIRNDSMYMGLLPLINRYANMMAENDVTMRITDINLRALNTFTAPDDETMRSVDNYLDALENGKLAAIQDKSALLDAGLNVHNHSMTNVILTDLIEFQQYLKASLYNEIGLSANYNMKRESINSSEAQLGADAQLPLIDDMSESRDYGTEDVKTVFGDDWHAELSDLWEHNREKVVEGEEVTEEVTVEKPEDTKDENN